MILYCFICPAGHQLLRAANICRWWVGIRSWIVFNGPNLYLEHLQAKTASRQYLGQGLKAPSASVSTQWFD